ncbi:hypothetical protein [uncultured Piscinibacter sp.]|uniref:hypothetical protein n=1 Tax=uncultured Piscinibacter sp. TaxID=1131835 RepID=UPI002614540E|nr:hypothetical protein [uncultured Piscinibacter sp.]
MKLLGWPLATALLCGGTAAPAAPETRTEDSVERARIARERDQAAAQFEQRKRECMQQFAVTACVDEARATHRQTLLQLRREEGVLDEAQRKQRAQQRLRAIEEKRRAEQDRASAPPATRRPPPLQVKPPRAAQAASRAAATDRPASAPDRSAEELRSRERFEARQREAQAHRDEVQRRRAEREKAGKKPSAPLPDAAAR